MITTGYPRSSATRKTEIIDIASGVTCSDLEDFPVEIYGGVGGNLQGTQVVCGGVLGFSTYSEKCYKFTTTGGWQEFVSMNDKRSAAAGIVYQKKLHVFGGWDPSLLQSSEIISEDGGVIDGPDLPTAVEYHAIAAVNSSVSILSGGKTYANDYSSQTWFYNHETGAFLSGPTLLEGRRRHASATIVDKVTKARIPVVTGGSNGNYMDSTELLIDGQWQTGKIQCIKQNIFLKFAFIVLFV
jgi:hypothetical protein